MTKEDLMPVEELAGLLGYKIQTVYKKARNGEIPSLPISARRRAFVRATIEYWLRNKEVHSS